MQNFHNFSGTILQKSAIKNAISRFFCTFYKYRDGTPSKKLWFALSTTTPKSLLKSRSQKSLLESRSMVHAGLGCVFAAEKLCYSNPKIWCFFMYCCFFLFLLCVRWKPRQQHKFSVTSSNVSLKYLKLCNSLFGSMLGQYGQKSCLCRGWA